MTTWGYTLSSEEFPASVLVRQGSSAEDAGFDFVTVSDHFHPWTRSQGHSPFAWTTIGALALGTDRVRVGTGVTCPIMRYHPSIIAQAASTAAELLGGRFFLGVGTGEALNEHVHGAAWPALERRQAMLTEAIEVIRQLWTGETVDLGGPLSGRERPHLHGGAGANSNRRRSIGRSVGAPRRPPRRRTVVHLTVT